MEAGTQFLRRFLPLARRQLQQKGNGCCIRRRQAEQIQAAAAAAGEPERATVLHRKKNGETGSRSQIMSLTSAPRVSYSRSLWIEKTVIVEFVSCSLYMAIYIATMQFFIVSGIHSKAM